MMTYDNPYGGTWWIDFVVIAGLCLIPILGFYGPTWIAWMQWDSTQIVYNKYL